jgi:hypothetical protein
MALVMDLPQMGERYEEIHFVPLGGGGGGGKWYEVNRLRTEPPLLMGAHPLLGPLKGAGPENRDFIGPK